MSRKDRERKANERHKREGALMIPPPAKRPGEPTIPVLQTGKEIIAWRGWYVLYDPYNGARLRSVSWPVTWEGPTLTAHVVPVHEPKRNQGIYWGSPITPPNDPTSGGIYALREDLWKKSDYAKQCHVWGDVALTGTVVQGSNGYRAERATVRSLILRKRAFAEFESHMRDLRTKLVVYGGSWAPPAFPESVSLMQLASDLSDRYQVDVEIAS